MPVIRIKEIDDSNFYYHYRTKNRRSGISFGSSWSEFSFSRTNSHIHKKFCTQPIDSDFMHRLGLLAFLGGALAFGLFLGIARTAACITCRTLTYGSKDTKEVRSPSGYAAYANNAYEIPQGNSL